MSLRKRSLLSLLVVLGLTALSIVAIVLKPTVLGLDLQGGTEVILQAEDTANGTVTPDALKRAVNIINNRVNRLGVAEPEVQVQGSDKIRVALPGVEDEALVNDLVKAAQLKLFAYQSLLVGYQPYPAPAPSNNPSTDLYSLITLANETPADPDTPGAAGPYVYLFRKDAAHTYILGPNASKKAIATQLKNANPAVAAELEKTPKAFEYRTVPKGLVILTLALDQSYADATLCGEPGGQCALLKDQPGLKGDDVKAASLGFDTANRPSVILQFSGAGQDKFAAVTKQLVNDARDEGRPVSEGDRRFHTFAISLDGVVISQPFVSYIDNPNGIDSNTAEIGGGGFTEKEARTLADQISSGSLPIELNTVSTSQVGATLGKDSLRRGLIAALAGLIIVVVGLVAYYRVLGLIAASILVIYGVFLWAIAKLIPIALTLPGIAGVILTVGVAADASVVIFERVREEIRQGRPPKTAVLSGYKRGITAIIDGNIVTLLTAVFIFLLSTSGPRGFAFTLLIGVLLALFTAIIATPAALGLLVESKLFKNEKLVGLHSREPRWKMDVVGKWKFWIGISFIPLVIGLVFVFTKGINQGIDFTGGSKQQIVFATGTPSETDVRDVVSTAGYPAAKVQTFTTTLSGEKTTGYTIETESLPTGGAEKLVTALNTKFQQQYGAVETLASENVGPTFGRDVVRNAIWAILFSFLAIIAYLTFRFEFKLAIPALASVVHDVWLSLTIYSIAGLEVTAATVAAFLTILGYSLYDVVIVFDRIRENEPLMRGQRYRNIVNRSVHETLTRSIITMISTLLPVLVLFLFGGDTLKDFSFALLIGILAGGISSIFISAPLAALWKEHEPDQQKVAARLAKKQARMAAVDADILDVEALARAEASMAAETAGVGPTTDELPEPDELAIDAGDAPPAAADVAHDAPEDESDLPDDDPSGGNGGEPTKPPKPRGDRQRRHQSVQRKRRR